jgi:hypothetical protein
VYRRSYRRIAQIVAEAVDAPDLDAEELILQLRERDDNGILAWCFHGNGQRAEPFSRLRMDHPDVWRLCCERLP